MWAHWWEAGISNMFNCIDSGAFTLTNHSHPIDPTDQQSAEEIAVHFADTQARPTPNLQRKIFFQLKQRIREWADWNIENIMDKSITIATVDNFEFSKDCRLDSSLQAAIYS